MAVEGFGGGATGIAFIVSYGVVNEIIAADCSSPQTTELNAPARAPTLMKWVGIGVAEAAVVIVAAAMWDKRMAKPILVGGTLGIVVKYLLYRHGRQAGLQAAAQGAAPTESWG